MDFHQLVDHLPLAARDCGHIHTNVSSYDAKTTRGMNERHGLGTLNDILARQAGDVRARAADHRTFDDDRLLASAGQCPAEKFACDPTPDDQVFKMLGVHGSRLLSLIRSSFGESPPKAAPRSTECESTSQRLRSGHQDPHGGSCPAC